MPAGRKGSGERSAIPLGAKPVAAGFGDQQPGCGWIGLDLLPKAIDVGFERVSGDGGIVAPDFAQQRLPRHRLVSDTVQIFEDRGFFFGEPDFFVAVAMHKHLRRRLEFVRTEQKNRVVRLIVLAKVGMNARKQYGHAERFGDVVVGASVEPGDGIVVGVSGGQHDDGRAHASLTHAAANLAAIHIRQTDVEQDDVENLARSAVEAAGPIAGLADDREFTTGGELLLERTAQKIVVIDNQNGSCS